MAGIAGQPTPKPSDLKPQDPYAELDAMAAPAGKDPYAELDAMDAVPQQQEQPMGQRVAEVAADWAPAVGGLAGGIAGSMAGGVGAIPGAAAGGAIGQSVRRLIEINLLGKGADSTVGQELKDVGVTGAVEGGSQLVGGAIGKAGGKLVAKFGPKVAAAVADSAEAPLNYVKSYINTAREKIEKPVLDFIMSKGTQLTPEASGDAAKSLLKQNIQQKYGPFIQAYADLDQVSKALPLQDATRLKFTDGLKNQAMELSSDAQRVVRNFAEKFNAADNGARFSQEIGSLQDAIDGAYKNGANNLGKTLSEIKTKAVGYFEGETTKLAARVSAGKATPQEMQFLDQVMKTRGIQDDPVKYAKSLAKDYLTSKDKITKDYSAFRSFLEDVGEQVKVKPKQGPAGFIHAIEDVPSEKLIEKMFDPKNAAALRRMKAETPEVFDEVVKSKVTQLVQKSSPDGVLDLKSFRKEVLSLPPNTRSMLMSGSDLKNLNRVVDSPRLKSLASLEKAGENSIVKLVGNIVEASRLAGESTVRGAAKAANTTAGRQAVGKAAIGTGNALVNAFKPPEPDPQ